MAATPHRNSRSKKIDSGRHSDCRDRVLLGFSSATLYAGSIVRFSLRIRSSTGTITDLPLRGDCKRIWDLSDALQAQCHIHPSAAAKKPGWQIPLTSKTRKPTPEQEQKKQATVAAAVKHMAEALKLMKAIDPATYDDATYSAIQGGLNKLDQAHRTLEEAAHGIYPHPCEEED